MKLADVFMKEMKRKLKQKYYLDPQTIYLDYSLRQDLVSFDHFGYNHFWSVFLKL